MHDGLYGDACELASSGHQDQHATTRGLAPFTTSIAILLEQGRWQALESALWGPCLFSLLFIFVARSHWLSSTLDTCVSGPQLQCPALGRP